MESYLAQARQQLDQSKLAYHTWKFTVSILETLVQYHPRAPQGTFPYENIFVMGLPTAQGQLKTYYGINVNITPDTIALAHSMNITTLPQPVTVKFHLSGNYDSDDGRLFDWSIDPDRSDYKGLDLIVPETLLRALARQIGPRLVKPDLQRESGIGWFDFDWPVYLVIPPTF